MSRSTPLAVATLLSLVLVSALNRAHAQGLPDMDDTRTSLRNTGAPNSVEVRVGAMHSTNILNIAHDQRSGTIYTAGLLLDANHDGRRLDYIAAGDLSWMEYPSDTFQSKLLGYFNGTLSYEVIPERFAWRVQETYGQQIVDPFVSNTPDNLANVNYITTGPVLVLPITTTTMFQLTGGYSKTTRESAAAGDTRYSGADDTRYSGEVSLIHDLTPRNAVSLNVSQEHVEFAETLVGANYDQQQATIGYQATGGRTGLNAEVGYARLDTAGRTSNGLLLRLNLRRQLSASTSLNLFASRQFSDSGDIFRVHLSQSGGSAPEALGTASPFEDRTYGLSFGFERPRTTFSLSGSRSEERYANDPLTDRNVTRFDASVTRRVGPRLSIRFQATSQDEDYLNLALDARDLSALAGLEWYVGARVGLALRYEWYDRSASELATGYTDRRIGLAAFLRPLDRPRR